VKDFGKSVNLMKFMTETWRLTYWTTLYNISVADSELAMKGVFVAELERKLQAPWLSHSSLAKHKLADRQTKLLPLYLSASVHHSHRDGNHTGIKLEPTKPASTLHCS